MLGKVDSLPYVTLMQDPIMASAEGAAELRHHFHTRGGGGGMRSS